MSLSLEHMDKSYVDSRNQIRDTSSALAYVGTNRGGNRPIADRQQLYKVRIPVFFAFRRLFTFRTDFSLRYQANSDFSLHFDSRTNFGS